MKNLNVFAKTVLTLSFIAAITAGCSGSSKGSGDQSPGQEENPNKVNWESIPAEFNPRMEATSFKTGDINTIKVDIFSFKDDFEIVYSADIPAGTGILKLYSVYKDSASFGGLQPHQQGQTLALSMYGSYACSIEVTNGQITHLKGGCYVRAQLILPTGSEIEIYNAGSLASRRFIPISAEQLVTNVDHASFSDDKLATIDDFLNSYVATSKTPTLLAKQLGQVVHEFIQPDAKMQALSKLQAIVTDRQNLHAMIDDEFTFFDRERARQICGVP